MIDDRGTSASGPSRLSRLNVPAPDHGLAFLVSRPNHSPEPPHRNERRTHLPGHPKGFGSIGLRTKSKTVPLPPSTSGTEE